MRTEKFFFMLFIISLVMKLLHIPGADIVLMLALGLLSLLYLLFGFYFFSDGHFRQQNLILSILAGILLGFAPVGILFRLQYFSGSRVQVLFGGMFSLIILLVVVILRLTSASEDLRGYYRNMIWRSSILAALSILLFFTPRPKLIELQYWDDPRMVELKNNYLRDPANRDNRKRLEDYIRQKEK